MIDTCSSCFKLFDADVDDSDYAEERLCWRCARAYGVARVGPLYTRTDSAASPPTASGGEDAPGSPLEGRPGASSIFPGGFNGC